MAPDSPSSQLHPHTASSQFSRPISPSRKSQQRPFSSSGRDVQSLLSGISADFVLQAVTGSPSNSASQARNTSKQSSQSHEFISETIANASSAERVWAHRAATFGKKTQDWTEELAAWPWHSQNDDQNSFAIRWDDKNAKEYGMRATSIRAELKELEIDELKGYVRHAHSQANPNTSSSTADKPEMINDFTAMVTALIVQALPILARLNSLLGLWSTRFTVLHQIPSFLKDLNDCRGSMLSAQLAICSPKSPRASRKPAFSYSVFEEIQTILQDQISRLAQQIDSMLDFLEGSQDTLPDIWLDSVDELEKDFASWVDKAQQLATNNELDTRHNRTRMDFTNEDEHGSACGPVHRRSWNGSSLNPDPREQDSQRPRTSHYEVNSTLAASSPMSDSISGVKLSQAFDKDVCLDKIPERDNSMAEAGAYQSRDDHVVNSIEKQMTREFPNNGARSEASTRSDSNKEEHDRVSTKSCASPTSLPSAPCMVADTPKTPASDAGNDLARPAALEITGEYLPAGSNSRPALLPVESMPKRAVTSIIGLSEKGYGNSPKGRPMDVFQQKVNSILQTIPVDIRLTTASDNDETAPVSALEWRTKPTTPRQASLPRFIRSQTSSNAAPNGLVSPRSMTNGFKSKSSDIRLYHLHQPGKDTPVKLYIRLVGEEGDRVMVRIGGGWADLGEYLREYAGHRGKRSVSDAKFNMQGVSTPGSSITTSTGVSPYSRPVSPSSASRSGLPVLPRQWTSPANFSSPPQTPPDHWSSDAGSPSPSLGLAGPKSKKVNISPRKQAWVEGMLRQARRTSNGDTLFEKDAEQDLKPGSLGRAGGVKRVFLKTRKESL